MKKLLFVMNPNAGMKKANKVLPEILQEFNRAGYEVVTYITSCGGEAEKIVGEKAKDVDLVVCSGGDGTYNETISGILKSGAKTPVGYIPSGSTNDFAASLKLSTNPLQAAKDIVAGAPESYDVGKFGERYFSYVASFGAFTKASYTTPQNIKNALGHTAYVLEGINELSQIKPFHIRMETESKIIEDDFLFGAISNSTSVGGILTLDPKQVDMQDGKFEILLIRAPHNLAEIAECIQAVQTQKYNCAMLTFLSARKVTVTADPEMLWTLDGEREEGHSVVTAENIHLAINVMKPQE